MIEFLNWMYSDWTHIIQVAGLILLLSLLSPSIKIENKHN